MDDVALGSDADARQLNELASLFDAPAFIRRARGVQDALTTLLARCRDQHERWLLMPRIRLGTLHAEAGSFDALLPFLAGPGEVAVLESLEGRIAPRLRVTPGRADSPRVLRRGLLRLLESLTRFNTRWSAYVGQLDLRPVNHLRDKYNRYYVLEKACSLRSDLLARQGFVPMAPLSVEEVLGHLSLLEVPRLGEDF
jgi:hypothetical protein